MKIGIGIGLTTRRGPSGAAPSFSPASLFASGEEGAWYEPSTTTCFTDTEGTTPAAVGDSVARINDSSGNGNHATQATAAARPTLQQTAGGLYYLSFDGSDDGMATASINFTATDKMSVFAGVEKESDAAPGIVVELTNVSINPGAFSLFAGNTTATRRWAWSVASTQNFIGTADLPAPATAVMSSIMDRSAATALEKLGPRLNGSTPTISENAAFGLVGNFANDSLHIGYRGLGGANLNGKIFGLIVRGASSTTGEIDNTETYLAAKSGVTL